MLEKNNKKISPEIVLVCFMQKIYSVEKSMPCVFNRPGVAGAVL